MTLNYVTSFLAVVQYGTFQSAAQALYITQPALTTRIQNLERELGGPLFIRGKTSTVLTENGQIFLPHAKKIVETFALAKMEITQLPREIAIGSVMSLSSELLPKIISELKQDKPYVKVTVKTGFSIDLISKVESGELAFAFVQEADKPGLVSLPFYHDPISLFVPRGHKFQNATVSLEQIAEEPMIGHDMAIYWERILKLFQSHGIKPNIIFNNNALSACQNMVINGLGIAFMPELSLTPAIERGDLCPVKIAPELNLARTLVVIYKEGKTLPPYLDQFLRIMRRMNLYLEGVDYGAYSVP